MSNLDNFEKDISRLREIVSILESESATLSEAMELCKEGVALTNKCKNDLQTASLQIETLSKSITDNIEG